MFMALRNKLAALDSYINPFNRRGALRLSRYHPRIYQLLTLSAAVGGYAVLWLFPLLLLCMPVALYFTLPVASTPLQWFLVTAESALLLVGAGGTLTLLTLRFPPPTGLELDRDRFPRLYELLQELDEIYGHPRIDRVVLRDRFDVRIVKTPHRALSFTTCHTLVIGLPLLLTLSPIDVHALVARRLGQLAGEEGRLNSWLYYLRDLWVEYQRHCETHPSWLAQPLCAFLHWYVPRYRALSLGAARWSELDADLAAFQALNDRDVVRAVCGQAMMDDYLNRVFWPGIVEAARSTMKPEQMPHARMAELFRDGLPADERDELIKRLAARRGDPDSTVPSLRERLEHMGHRKLLPPKAMSVSAAQFYLGGACEACIQTIDKRSRQKVRAKVIHFATLSNA